MDVTDGGNTGTEEGCFSVNGNTSLEENIGSHRSRVSQPGAASSKTRCVVLKDNSRSLQLGWPQVEFLFLF